MKRGLRITAMFSVFLMMSTCTRRSVPQKPLTPEKTTPTKFEVSFETNGASAIQPKSVISGQKLTKPEDPTKSGLIFAGWFLDGDLTKPFDFELPIKENLKLFAAWTNTLFGKILLSKTIPNDVYLSNDVLVKNIYGNYTSGAALEARYVKYGSNGNGTSWDKASGSLKVALERIIDASVTKVYIVLVAASPEAYKAGAEMSMKDNVAIVGGFKAASNEDYTTSLFEKTILSGGQKHKVFVNKAITRSALLYGVTVTKGNGISGGGMYNTEKSSPKIANVLFSENLAENGGGMYNGSSTSPLLLAVSFSENTAKDGGGGMHNSGAMPIVANATFYKNRATNGGGIFNTNSSSSQIINSTFFENNADGNGGGLYNDNDKKIITIANTIFWSNTSARGDDQIYVKNDAFGVENIILYNTILQGGKETIGRETEQDINITDENLQNTPPLVGIYKNHGGNVPTLDLASNSPAIDVGLYARFYNKVYFSQNNSQWFILSNRGEKETTDLPAEAECMTCVDARYYKREGKPDLGAYEVQASPSGF